MANALSWDTLHGRRTGRGAEQITRNGVGLLTNPTSANRQAPSGPREGLSCGVDSPEKE
jgi:hypothetical protein